MPFWIIAENGVPAMIDWPTRVCAQAMGLPPASSPARRRLTHSGR